MTLPLAYGGLNAAVNDRGTLLSLNGYAPLQDFSLPSMPTTSKPYIAHLYDHNLVFKQTLGGAKILNKPGLKLTASGGYQPITLKLASPVTGIALGDVIRLTEDGDPASAILYSGNVETAPSNLGIGPGATQHLVTVAPWMFELGDADFSKTYATLTDVAQFVRDAVAQTAHCSVSPLSCPDTGIKAIYDFQSSNALDAVHVAKQIAGANWVYFVSAEGVVWFYPVVTANPATITLIKGTDYNTKKPVSTIVGMRTIVPVVGGAIPGDTGKLSATYTSPSNIPLYGRRTFNPTPSYPTVTDQATLNAIAASLGAQYDRVLTTVEVSCPALGKRLSPARPGGITVRLFEPAKESLQDPVGTGGYSSTFVLQDVEVNGPTQKLLIGDIPYSDTDPTYEATRVAQRTAVVAATAVPTPALAPQAVPTATIVMGDFVVTSTGVQAMGGGIVIVGSATFTTPRAGTCQVVGAIDARMVAWDNFVPTPRRAVWMDLPGIVTGAKQELPFSLTRATYDGSSASGIAIAAGTYTVSWKIQTVEFNQMQIFSGWGRVIWVG